MTDDRDRAPSEPFDLLGHEIRIDVVEALVDAQRADPRDPALSFAELRERAGVRDSGQFNYHLDKLRDQFVRQTEEGYRLSAAGREVAGAVLSGSFETRPEKGPVDLEESCGYCDAPVTACYEDGVLSAECEDGHEVHGDYFPPGIVDRVSIPTAMELSALLGHHKIELLVRGVCSNCDGPTETVVRADEDREGEYVDGAYFETTCQRCGFHFTGPPGLVVLTHPALRAFYLERDRDVRTAALWSLPFLVDESRWRVESRDPPMVEIDVGPADDGLRYVVAGDCTVLEYERTG